ncbi:MAG TPA: hypothetical protein PKA55_11145 [Rhodoblastus sp.]|nr:hypothetical protein [Rhodoblastus sp.]
MNISPVRPADPPPQFADFVAAAATRRRAADDSASAFRIVAPGAGAVPSSPHAPPRAPAHRTAPFGYAEILDLAENLAPSAALDRTAALAAVNRLMRALAAEHGQSPGEFVRAAAIAPREKLPARNAADAESALKASLAVDDETRGLVTLDVHAARRDEKFWQIAVFDQSAARFGTFPYATPPLLVMTAPFDPAQAGFAAAATLAGAFAGRRASAVTALAENSALPEALGLIATIIVVALLLAGAPWAATIVALATLALLRWRARQSRRASDA